MRQFSILAVFLAAAAWSITAEESVPSEWILGIAGLPESSISNLDSSDQSALSSLPEMILSRIQYPGQRFVSLDEKKMRMERERLALAYSAGADAAAAREKRDAAALSPLPSQKRAAGKRTLGSEYSKTAKTHETSGGKKAAEPEMTVNIVLWSGHDSGKFIADSKDPAFVCDKENLDYLIRWEIQELGGFFRIRMEGWNAVLGRPDFHHTAYCPYNDIPSVVDELAYAILLASIGRPSALIVFSVDPAETRILVDGRLLAPGIKALRVYEEREYRISGEAKGFQNLEIPLKPGFGKNENVVLELKPLKGLEVDVDTDPEGATLYLDGIWAGTTPVSISLFGTPGVVLMKYPGYEDLFAVVDSEVNAGASFTLEKSVDGSSSALTRRKDDFYKALGFFVASLPVSIVSYGVYLQNYMLYLEYPENQEFSRRNNISLGCFAAAAGVSGALFVNAAIRLVRYVKSAR